MSVIFLQILTLLTLFSFSATESEDAIAALKKILNELNLQTKLEDKYDENYDTLIYRPRYFNREKSRHHDRGSPNLMNVQTMNLYVKPNKRQREEAELKAILRTDAERMCSLAGRCGCTGTRCSSPNKAEDNIADEVDRVVNEINKHLAVNDNEKNRNNVDEEMKSKEYRGDMDDRKRDKHKEDDIKIGGGDKIAVGEVYESRSKLDKGEGILKSKRIKINDDIDVMILDKSDLEILLRNNDFDDLTRYHGNNDNEVYVDRDQELFQKVLTELKKIVEDDNKGSIHRSSNDITPEDLFGHYENVKHLVISKILNYMKSEKSLTYLPVEHLTPRQKQKLRHLKMRFRRGELEQSDVEDIIVRILFGDESDLKILVQSNDNSHIYVPQWLYNKVVKFKNNHRIDGKNLRSLKGRKRILPLTSQQKDRLLNKEKAKTIPKLVWRKHLDHDTRRLGIPFNFEVHGLSQVAP